MEFKDSRDILKLRLAEVMSFDPLLLEPSTDASFDPSVLASVFTASVKIDIFEVVMMRLGMSFSKSLTVPVFPSWSLGALVVDPPWTSASA